MRRELLFVSLCLLAACRREDSLRPIPDQAATVEAQDPPREPCFVWMSERRANSFLVKDIQTGNGWRRWTGGHPAVRCAVPAGRWQAAFDFDVSQATLDHTGPIMVTWRANGEMLGSMRCDREAAYRFRAPLPKDLAGQSVVLEATIDRPYISPADGAELGVLVTAAGFLVE